MDWSLTSDRPIYMQLMEEIQLNIVSGRYKIGERLPAVRDMAAQASVNPNTMQKALSELERLELVYTQRTAGRFITEDEKIIKALKNRLATEQLTEFYEKLQRLGFNRAEIIALVEHLPAEGEGEEE